MPFAQVRRVAAAGRARRDLQLLIWPPGPPTADEIVKTLTELREPARLAEQPLGRMSSLWIAGPV